MAKLIRNIFKSFWQFSKFEFNSNSNVISYNGSSGNTLLLDPGDPTITLQLDPADPTKILIWG